MSKLIAAVALACLWTSAAAAATVTLVWTVDRDRPGALEALQQSNPVHHEKVTRIVDGVVHQPDTVVLLTNVRGRVIPAK